LEEAVVDDEAAFEALAQTVMEVPTEIVPAIRELITNTKQPDSVTKEA
jgi:hypothetical protein